VTPNDAGDRENHLCLQIRSKQLRHSFCGPILGFWLPEASPHSRMEINLLVEILSSGEIQKVEIEAYESALVNNSVKNRWLLKNWVFCTSIRMKVYIEEGEEDERLPR
jgi:hypothetical protein